MSRDRPTGLTGPIRGQTVRTAGMRSTAHVCHSCEGPPHRDSQGVRERDQEPLHLADRLALRPAEVARALGLSERSVRQILPELPHTRIGTAVVVPVDELRRWLRDRAQQERGAVDRAVDEVLAQLQPDQGGEKV